MAIQIKPDGPYLQTLHGYPIYMVKAFTAPIHDGSRLDYYIILARSTGAAQTWVTWWMDLEGNCSGGHYFEFFDDARRDFEKRRF